ncbi:MAG: hypothetical protein GXO26_02340 [Crenarchaeota archaeon]|nr:hypothetical protein [Thermoproteota archaeon]
MSKGFSIGLLTVVVIILVMILTYVCSAISNLSFYVTSISSSEIYIVPSRPVTVHVFATCVSGRYLIIVGYVGLVERHGIIIMMDRYLDRIVRTWIDYNISELYDCVVVGRSIIVVGDVWLNASPHLVIYEFSNNLNLEKMSIDPSDSSMAFSVTFFKGYLYVSGEPNFLGLVEQRDVLSLSLVGSYTTDFSISDWKFGNLFTVFVDNATRTVWVGGYYLDFGDLYH